MEMYYILYTINKLNTDKLTILYVGAGDGKHINSFKVLFPNIYWILYDPRKFMIT